MATKPRQSRKSSGSKKKARPAQGQARALKSPPGARQPQPVAKKQAPGRPSLFTPERQQLILLAVGQGNYMCDVADAAGVGLATLNEWIARGEGRDPDRPATPEFAEFAAAIKRAQGEGVVRAVNRLKTAASGAVRSRTTIKLPDGNTQVTEQFYPPAWQADAWFLERRYRERWGRHDRHDVASPGSDRLELGVDTTELQQVIKRIYGQAKADSESNEQKEEPKDDATT